MSKITRYVLLGSFALLMFLFVAYVYVLQSRVTGYEFNPYSWQIRHFEFYADPFTNKELIGIDRTGKVTWTIDPAITTHLAQGTSAQGASSRWDLIELNDYRPKTSEGPATILVDAVTSRRSGWSSSNVEFWNNWSKTNATEAAFFWKAVQSLTIHGAYTDIPALLEVAVSSPSKIPELSDSLTADALLRRAQQLQADGDSKSAKAAASDGLIYAPNSSELKKIAAGK